MQSKPNCARLCLSKPKSPKAAASRKVTLTTKAPLKPGSPADPPRSTWCSGSRLEDVTPAGEVTQPVRYKLGVRSPDWREERAPRADPALPLAVSLPLTALLPGNHLVLAQMLALLFPSN